jgi:hypothetical protein
MLMGAAAIYAVYNAIRPWHLRWGATRLETGEPLPGDELVPNPRLSATRAIDIEAPASDVWPWLAQLGQGRGGFYSYTRLEKLAGAGIENADRVLPEFQDIKEGDIIRLAPEQKAGGGPVMTVARVEPNRLLLMFARVDTESWNPVNESDPQPENYAMLSWNMFLQPVGDKATRLIVRSRFDWSPSASNYITWRILTEPAHFIMERAMLLGIKARAEKLATGEIAEMPEPEADRQAA